MENMEIVYQPIVKLNNGQVVGYEALSRFPKSQQEGQPQEPADPPDQVFKRAWEEGNGYGLEIMAADLALKGFINSKARANGLYLSINASPKTIKKVAPSLIDISPDADIPWDQLVVEVTEHDSIDDHLPLYNPIYYLRQRGVRIALDDVGVGNSGMARIFQLMPHILKTDRMIVSNIDKLPLPSREHPKITSRFSHTIKYVRSSGGHRNCSRKRLVRDARYRVWPRLFVW